ncbi:MAG: hypothetical protein P4K93_05430 [Terracidiphilus sp.]|nr:hypothetical protein [Terracidiphilus sp.]MDR3797569.1 hypothetical protein [Terracidiphilus sp.]
MSALRIPQRARIYLGCEGQSEQSYGKCLNVIADTLGLPLFLDCDVLGGGDPLSLVERAIRGIHERVTKRGAFLHRAIILDTDKLGNAPERDGRVALLAQKHRIHLIWQHPCHEGFLLRHLPDQETMRPQTSELALEALKRIWPEYRKGMPAIELATWIHAQALRRAATVEADMRDFLAQIGLMDRL